MFSAHFHKCTVSAQPFPGNSVSWHETHCLALPRLDCPVVNEGVLRPSFSLICESVLAFAWGPDFQGYVHALPHGCERIWLVAEQFPAASLSSKGKSTTAGHGLSTSSQRCALPKHVGHSGLQSRGSMVFPQQDRKP